MELYDQPNFGGIRPSCGQNMLASQGLLIAAEDGIREGGVGMSIEDAISECCTPESQRPYVEVLGVPTKFIPQAKPDVILRQLGLDAEGIVATANRLLGR